MRSGKWQRHIFLLRPQLKFPVHCLAGEIDGLQFQSAPMNRFTRWVNENIVDLADEIPTFFHFAGLGSESIQETNLIQYKRRVCLEQRFSNPVEN